MTRSSSSSASTVGPWGMRCGRYTRDIALLRARSDQPELAGRRRIRSGQAFGTGAECRRISKLRQSKVLVSKSDFRT